MTLSATTPNQISYVRLASLKGMVKLESKGLKTRGGAIRPRIATELGLKPRDSFDKFIETIQSKMEEHLAIEANK
jgi:hypothetical protein